MVSKKCLKTHKNSHLERLATGLSDMVLHMGIIEHHAWFVTGVLWLHVSSGTRALSQYACLNPLIPLPGNGIFMYFSFYGPLEAYFDKTWKPNDVDLLK